MGVYYINSKLPELIPREIIFSEPQKSNPKISPDGKRLAYLAPVNNIMNIWVRTIGKDDDRTVTNLKKRGIDHYIWATNKYIVYLNDINGDENWLLYRLDMEKVETKTLTPKNMNVRFFHSDIRNYPGELLASMYIDNPAAHDLYHIDIISGEITFIEKNPENIVTWLINNNFKPAGIIVNKDDGGTELMVKEDENSEWKKLINYDMEDIILSQIIGFSKDNKYIYILDSRNLNINSLIKMEIKTGKTEEIYKHNSHGAYTYLLNTALNQVENYEVLFNFHTCDVEAISFYKFRKEWIILKEKIKEDFESIKKLNNGDFSIISRDMADENWVICFENDDTPPSYYIFNRKSQKGILLFHSNPALNNYGLAKIQEVTCISRDGLTIHGYITYPPEKERKNLPMVIFVHRGPWIRDTWGFNPIVQWFANRGYACLQINYRGSTGYGKDFLNAGNKEWGGKMQDDLTDAVKWAIDKGIADPNKIAIYGSGYGGYAALGGATFTPDLFTCAIGIQCPGDLISFIKSTPLWWNRKRFIKRIGDPDGERDFLISRSPFYHLDGIKIPILISYGLKNSRLNYSETYKIVSTLKGKGIEVEHVVFPDEGYGITQAKNRIKFFAVIEKFLTKYLNGRYEEGEINTSDKFNDRFIIDKIKEGDKESFKIMMEYYEKPILKHLFNITGDSKASMELLQETFFRVWLYIDSYSFLDDIGFSSWLFKIATNVAKNYISRNIKSNNLTNIDDTDLNTGLEEWKDDIEDKVFIQSIIKSLKEPYKTSLFLRYMEELDYKEIASIMNTNPNQIKNYLFRAKKAIIKSMKE